MKNDPEYGKAINRLRTHSCILEDVDLFNSRLIKSVKNPTGVDMSIDNKNSATVIVSTNLLRETINARKAHANCTTPNGPQLIICAALDDICSGLNSHEIISQLLKLNVCGLSREGALPGYIPLYVGMPVILRYKNVSTELGITNGSQGVIKQINTSTTTAGFTHCTSTIVQFPKSKAHLPHLPPMCFPITPIQWTFTTKIQGELIKVKRHQLPLQPAFAVTGHSAKGKTLPHVVVNLHEGGFAAYVAASRATSREGLYITEPVNLQMLNKPIPYDLHVENARLAIMEHNTLIKYGLQEGQIQKVPDSEAEENISQVLHPTFQISTATRPTQQKRKHKELYENTETQLTKKQKKKGRHTILYASGCEWSTDWSCAYDVFFMVFFHIHFTSNVQWKTSWEQHSMLASTLHQYFTSIAPHCQQNSSTLFNTYRDQMRDILSSREPNIFPRHGPEAITDVSDIFRHLNLDKVIDN